MILGNEATAARDVQQEPFQNVTRIKTKAYKRLDCTLIFSKSLTKTTKIRVNIKLNKRVAYNVSLSFFKIRLPISIKRLCAWLNIVS